MRNKLQSLQSNLNQGLIARESTIKLALLTLLAGENILLVGPPGTGKSYIARRMADSLAGDEQGNDYFEYLLTKFSTPEEIFGPLSISELKQDRFKRNTACYLPTVKTAFLDEIFKSSSSILNSLLTILNERVYHNGAEVQSVPLRALIAASNELPTEQAELSALYDRFLVRVFVDYVPENQRENFFRPLEVFELQPDLCITDAELAQIAIAAAQVEIPTEVEQAIQQIWIKHKEAFKEDRRESLSDRRLVKVIQLLRVSAVTNGRKKMDLSDVLLLKDCLWNHQDNAAKVMGIIHKELQRAGAMLADDASSTSAYRVVSNEPSTQAPNDSSTMVVDYKQPSKNAVIKGFSGNGTKQDPLLIQSSQDLGELKRPEISQKGYFFKQTTDIDLSEIVTWPKIDFVGTYDGLGFSVLGSKKIGTLFNSLHDSVVKSLKTQDMNLVKSASKTTFESCVASKTLINDGKELVVYSCQADVLVGRGEACEISHCIAYNLLVLHDIKDSSIFSCKTKSITITGCIENSNINNCLLLVELDSNHFYLGAVASRVSGSFIKNIYISGSVSGEYEKYFSGIAGNVINSTIKSCAIGPLSFASIGRKDRAYITRESVDSIFDNNICIDTNKRFFTKHDATLVESQWFNQRYFETYLDWDFDNIWVWNNKEKRPDLRYVGIDSIPPSKTGIINDKLLVDVFAKQLQANIWI